MWSIFIAPCVYIYRENDEVSRYPSAYFVKFKPAEKNNAYKCLFVFDFFVKFMLLVHKKQFTCWDSLFAAKSMTVSL